MRFQEENLAAAVRISVDIILFCFCGVNYDDCDHQRGHYFVFDDAQYTAVKSNALAELMNRASKIHWKNLSLTLNGRNSETKNDKNNPKVPKFSSCRGLSSTLSRKCGSTTLCGCLWVFCGCLWVFLGVCGC